MLVAVTFAPATAAPLGSVIVPRIVVDVVCAIAAGSSENANQAASAAVPVDRVNFT
jgi:hypothetical protein